MKVIARGCGLATSPSYIYGVNERYMVNEGDWVLYDGKRKRCYGIHVNGNIILKVKGRLVQVWKDRVEVIAKKLGGAK